MKDVLFFSLQFLLFQFLRSVDRCEKKREEKRKESVCLFSRPIP